MINIQNIPLSLYIHIPWCEKKCPYCDFNSHENQQHFDESNYIQALIDDLDQDINLFKDSLNRPIQSIFIGGGTPSLFSANAYKTLFDNIGDRLDIKHAEITLEANPSSSEQQKFSGYLQAGINRLSIGTQSFNPQLLKRIGRVHDHSEAMNAAISAKSAGFKNFNLDIMFALPGQSITEAIEDINQAISFSPTHLSCYQLTIEPNTLFYNQRPKLPSTDSAWTMQEQIQKQLNDAGYQQYEVSAYAQQEHQCQHNLNYWSFGDYLAIGAGAHGKVTTHSGQIQRYWKQKQPKKYLQTAQSKERIGDINAVSGESLMFEFMLNALRLKQGFDLSLFSQRTGLEQQEIETLINQQIDKNLLSNINGHISPTDMGYQFIDSMLNDFLPIIATE